jgi:hypothetical protein
MFSSRLPVKARNPSSRLIMPNRKITTPAEMSLKSGLIPEPIRPVPGVSKGGIFCESLLIQGCGGDYLAVRLADYGIEHVDKKARRKVASLLPVL